MCVSSKEIHGPFFLCSLRVTHKQKQNKTNKKSIDLYIKKEVPEGLYSPSETGTYPIKSCSPNERKTRNVREKTMLVEGPVFLRQAIGGLPVLSKIQRALNC